VRDDGETYEASKAQLWLWQCWNDYWANVQARKKRGDRLIVILNGDVVDGANHHGTNQTVSSSGSDEVRLAVQVLEPIKKMSDKIFIVRGTPSHVGVAGQQEEMVGQIIKSEKDGERSTFDFLPLEIDNLLFHFAHHGRVGGTPTTRHNATLKAASEHILNAARLGRKPADVLVRSHAHKFADSGDNFPTRCIQSPAFQLATGYIYRIAPDENNIADIGGLLFTIENSAYDMQWIGRNKYVPAQKETIKL